MDTTLTTGTDAVEALARALEPHTGPGWFPGTFTTDWVGASQSEAVASGAGRILETLRADPAAARALRDAIDPDGLRARLALAERVCLMFGWSPSHNETNSDKAAHELWLDWLDDYRQHGGTTDPPDHPDLSDARVAELARRRDATVARNRGLLEGTPDAD